MGRLLPGVTALSQGLYKSGRLRLGCQQGWLGAAKAPACAAVCGQATYRSGYLRLRAPTGRLRADQRPPIEATAMGTTPTGGPPVG
ncbi:hypothetical protein GW17_00007711 [Ensete ventricosum]|nr:hypothetical protein GW17_00007711 [Ensete ventricosum]RZS19766.1 hypothetical protein BHM03_00052213 [Ensete ventricosum]